MCTKKIKIEEEIETNRKLESGEIDREGALVFAAADRRHRHVGYRRINQIQRHKRQKHRHEQVDQPPPSLHHRRRRRRKTLLWVCVCGF